MVKQSDFTCIKNLDGLPISISLNQVGASTDFDIAKYRNNRTIFNIVTGIARVQYRYFDIIANISGKGLK
jgi:hypothetical protein